MLLPELKISPTGLCAPTIIFQADATVSGGSERHLQYASLSPPQHVFGIRSHPNFGLISKQVPSFLIHQDMNKPHCRLLTETPEQHRAFPTKR